MKCLKACSAGCFVVDDDGAVVAAAPEAGRARRSVEHVRETYQQLMKRIKS